MQDIESSIVIPVFNQWEFTRNCLKALASTTQGKAVEVIVIDNASTDSTPEACPVLGARLFGDAFRYIRCSVNMNFGPASNLGATQAGGEFLIFLNNDTVPLPGWYQPLIDDFSTWPRIAATGPVLLYPEREPFGHTVQHLGVFISPLLKIGHLYEDIPAASPLVYKRRFFQIITAACMVIRRNVFLAAGMFDEAFINGFEDVDLCLRLGQEGYRMTVNPKARVIHYTSQTPGRHRHDEANARHLATKSQKTVTPDWHAHLKNDGLSLRVGAWQIYQTALPPEQHRRLDAIGTAAPYEELIPLLIRYPFWENGWRRLTSSPSETVRHYAQNTLFDLFPSPDKALEFHEAALAARDLERAESWLKTALPFCKSIEAYSATARASRRQCARRDLAEMEAQYADWLANAERFNAEQLQPFLADLWRVLVSNRIALHLHDAWAYTAWRLNVDLPRRAADVAEIALHDGVAFSLLMSVYRPRTKYLAVALDSVLAQDYPHWELCVTVDVSTDPETAALLARYAERDARIRIAQGTKNGHAAVNTALAMARHPWVAVLDQGDALTPDALRLVAEAIAQKPDGLLLYSDHDSIDDDGDLSRPCFNNNTWDWDLLLCRNDVFPLAVYRTERVRELGGMKEDLPFAREYDLLLRYAAGADAVRLAHIPRVLVHRRARADRVLIAAARDARRAVQNFLDAVSPGATALPDSQWNRVSYPLPANRPLVTLICDMGEALPRLHAQLAALTQTTYSPCEILVLHSETCPQRGLDAARRIADNRVRLLAHAADASQAERLQRAADHARGHILGFVAAGITPISEGWLEELVACLCRDHVGACGGKVAYPNGSMAHGGYLTDASGRLKALFQNAPANQPTWFGWNRLARTVDALDGLCCFTLRETLKKLEGLDASLNSSIQDYCLRLGAIGLRTVWWPYAAFTLPENNARAAHDIETDAFFQERWAGRLTPCHDDLMIVEGNWAFTSL